jgi:3(or 17)beta-hydroxysteroid dehydrogenase
MSQRLKDKVALVTGAAGGLGQAICARLTDEGAHVVASDLQGTAIVLDVTREASWAEVMASITQRWGRLDILVNNAGFLKPATIEDTTLEHWRKTMAINSDGVFLGCKFAVAAMKAHGGVIINLSSTMGLRGMATHPAYSASKAAVRLLTQSVAKHCGEQGYPIRAVALLPGAVETDMLRQNIPNGVSEAEYFAQVRARHPIGRLGRPQDIADAVVFLASDEASFITGTDFIVDGGASI